MKEVLPTLIDPVLLSKLPGEKLLRKILSTNDFNHFINSINYTEKVKIYPYEELGKEAVDNYTQNWNQIKKELSDALKIPAPVKKETKAPTKVSRETIEDLNNNIDQEALKIAKKKKYEVIYENNNYRITKVGKNSVSLKAPNLGEFKVDISDFSKLTIVLPGGLKANKEDNDTIKNNQNIISGKDKSYTVKPIAEAFKNVIDAALKC